MKKDVLLALFIGFLIGSSIAILAVKLPSMLSHRQIPQEKSLEFTPEPSINKQLTETSLIMEKPPDLQISSEEDITLIGRSKPKTIIIVESPLDSFILESDKNGSFSAKLSLAEGGNPVYITSVYQSGETETKNLTLFYTTEKL